MKFRGAVIPSGNATAIEVPPKAMKDLGAQVRPPIVVTINGHTWRSRVARMRGLCLVGISAAHREAAGIAEGDVVDVDVRRDDAPRDVAAPPDLMAAFDAAPGAHAAFERLPFGLRVKHVRGIEEAKGAQTRRRRIEKLVASLTP